MKSCVVNLFKFVNQTTGVGLAKMATYLDESIDNYLYSDRYQKTKCAGWRNKSYFANTEAYIDNHHRAQFKFLLSQINPNLNPRLRKANTKDVAVQDNPKKDVSVQCSLGPRTLIARKRDTRKRRQETQTPGSPGSSVGGVRYPRTRAVYSPIASRRLASFLEYAKIESRQAQTGDPPETVKIRKKDEGEKSEDKTEKAKDENTWPHTKASNTDQSVMTEGVKVNQDGSKVKARVRFQVYFKQFCRTCQKSFNPYRVEDITCQTCNKARCMCQVTPCHVDPKRPHRQDLCGRCKGKRLSCDLTFSFKYII
ncbi:zygote arrest protein 1 isoform X2 [Oncorhynchus keta]|uniref:zygote arrest protein 1 isoform X2 n=1 Tax=Oncorhynchus keta TaxID=8018 RepID=UPI00227ACE43|nr:zygote arrest protein 1 isoform X2 [Oncorhynchus keta]